MLCVIAKLDEEATKRLAKLQEAAAGFGMTSRKLYGHITLISYLGEKEKGFIEACKSALQGQRSFAVWYEKVEVLIRTSIIVASPDRAGILTEIHDRLAGNGWDDLDVWSQKGVWHPHTTLIYHPEGNLTEAAQTMQDGFEPFQARISRIEFSRVTEGGYEIMDELELLP